MNQKLNIISKRYNLKNPDEKVSIILTRKEWYHIWDEAKNSTGFTNRDSEVIEKLKRLIEDKKQ